MKTLLLTLTFLTLNNSPIFVQEKNTLTINFSGMNSNRGALFVGLYNNEVDFLKTHFKGAIIKITNKKATVVFKDLPDGEYSVSAFHDKNDNKKMDTNFIGIPKEPIGISNNAKGFMGPPKYKDAKFIVSQNTQITIAIE